MRFNEGDTVTHPDIELFGEVISVFEHQQGYVIKDLYWNVNFFFYDADDLLQRLVDVDLNRPIDFFDLI